MEKATIDGEGLRKKARKKYLSNSLAAGLVRIPDSPLNKQYAMTFACCDALAVNDRGDLTTQFYCKNRWCQTCASIKMATMINKYLPTFSEMSDLHFVTLTLRSVGALDIADRIEYMQRQWRAITDLARTKRRRYDSLHDFKGLRKTELKVGKGGGYHGHYHIIVEGAENAEFIRDQWLRLNKGIVSRLAQDVRSINPEKLEPALLELFKYATKCTAAENSGNEIVASPKQMDTIFRAVYKKRLFQPFGGVKAVNEDDFELTPETVKKAAGIYEWIGHDWYHTRFGHHLSGWEPEEMEIALKDW